MKTTVEVIHLLHHDLLPLGTIMCIIRTTHTTHTTQITTQITTTTTTTTTTHI
jgi:hypothetical protein